jgi:hypothetical protein
MLMVEPPMRRVPPKSVAEVEEAIFVQERRFDQLGGDLRERGPEAKLGVVGERQPQELAARGVHGAGGGGRS